jgi:hypothetical protein
MIAALTGEVIASHCDLVRITISVSAFGMIVKRKCETLDRHSDET